MCDEKRVVLKNLSKVKRIIIREPGKGNGVVVMNRDDYIEKMSILQDSTESKHLPMSTTQKIYPSFNGFVIITRESDI